MNRIDFCTECKKMRVEITCVSLNDVWRKTGFQPTQTKRMENGVNNFGMNNAILYISAINAYITLWDNTSEYTINTYTKLVEWIILTRKNKFTQRELAIRSQCSNITIAKIESGKSVVSIDVFLKIIDTLGYSLKIQHGK